MLSRTRVVFAVLVALAVGGAVAASYAAMPGPTIVGTATYPISVQAGNYDLISQVVDLPPGGVIPKHTHGGPVVAQVVTGEVTVTDAMGQKVFKAGQMFTESGGYVHAAANKGPVTARVAVSYLIPKGAEVTTIVK
ncbi:MAG TPA: cupin domain-containing protein [bacterium]|nr:cupin domain-containing protein [bacterium]